MTVGTERPPNSDSLRTQLVRAGIELLDTEGLEGVGLRAIARHTGVSHGAPRRHFPSHRSLLAAIARTGIEDLLAVVRPILSDDDRVPRERLVAAAHAYVSVARDRRAMFDLISRHDLLDGAGGNLRELTLPLIEEMSRLIAGPRTDDGTRLIRTVGLWTAIHGIAVLSANRSLEVGSGDVPTHDVVDALIEQAVDHHLDD